VLSTADVGALSAVVDLACILVLCSVDAAVSMHYIVLAGTALARAYRAGVVKQLLHRP